jgi:hypothetical protein
MGDGEIDQNELTALISALVKTRSFAGFHSMNMFFFSV